MHVCSTVQQIVLSVANKPNLMNTHDNLCGCVNQPDSSQLTCIHEKTGTPTILRFVVIFLGTSRNIQGLYLTLHDKRFLPHVR
jgi:hypothetical protein